MNEAEMKQSPFSFGIKALKKQLKAAGMPKHELNKTLRMYKDKLYTQVAEVKEKMEKEYEEKRIKDATDIKDAVITTPERSA